ncbi:ABC transporter ATP-binding protein [Conexibacter sp. CPCC 206217]|uniref:ABC transporter ATP-binding protein n=1 Tax=Conexibacter sp. CPCC 206217 TaxID=3064574 RepID=UPI00272922B4|nr:ABC transporter ATP-binding protein [Conexibacter sp. CPCC 206217]MDO8210100.1 ABC transporter ATP-binding protein [Conexibacter sp. CPCC 206217]
MTDTATETLEAREVHVEFGGVKALDGIDLTLARGETLGLIGPNGAGKSTLVNVLTGFQRPTRGDVLLDGRRITGGAPHRNPRQGIVRTFQSTRVFSGLTVEENVEVCALGVARSRRGARRVAREALQRAELWDRRRSGAGTLSTGDAHRLGVARSLAQRPRFLLLDEPAAGLNDTESEQLVEVLRGVRLEQSIGLLLIEHNMDVITALSERIQVIHEGRTIAVGVAEAVRRDPAVLDAYLGTERPADARA